MGVIEGFVCFKRIFYQHFPIGRNWQMQQKKAVHDYVLPIFISKDLRLI